MTCWSEMPSLIEVFPDAKTLLALQPEEVGDAILEMINDRIYFNDGRFTLIGILSVMNERNSPEWPQSSRAQVTQAVAEALAWLEHAGLAIEDPTQGNATAWRVPTRRGKQLRTRGQAATYRAGTILPTGLVNPDILEKSYASFMHGDHDIAVLAAFKAVEIAVRKAAGYQEGELGVPLMRKAFHPDTGPLTDKTVVVAEREAMASLFAGAIGAAKNPASHRDVEMSRIEAARLIVFASYLDVHRGGESDDVRCAKFRLWGGSGCLGLRRP